jgi:alkanesulfonate monooxygenase SsuD/methylene tetrahydromethanopterin reductase-like flavin-dependent oxidoreductase (luciferase family)
VRYGVFFFGGVEMNDAGSGPPASMDRRYRQEDFWHAQERLLDVGVLADRLGYDAYWLTEHHFQHEGYEVVPNAVLFGAFLAARTERIRIGAMFNIVPQWHPLRLAEDFATLHNLSGGRAILGVGRGTVPREAETLGTVVGSFDNPDQAEADRINREIMEEAMDVIVRALGQETFSFHGKHFDLPPAGIPDRGGTVQELTLVPRPKYPYQIWQAVTSPATLEHLPTTGIGGVFWLQHRDLIARRWDRYAEVCQQSRGETLAAGERRNLVLNVHIADTHEQAWAESRRGHDEFWKFLGPYGWSRGYLGPDGQPSAPGLIPTLEQSVDQGVWIIGTPDEVAEAVDACRQRLGVRDLTIFPAYPGDSYAIAEEQVSRFAEDVAPLLGSPMVPSGPTPMRV